MWNVRRFTSTCILCKENRCKTTGISYPSETQKINDYFSITSFKRFNFFRFFFFLFFLVIYLPLTFNVMITSSNYLKFSNVFVWQNKGLICWFWNVSTKHIYCGWLKVPPYIFIIFQLMISASFSLKRCELFSSMN